MIDSLVSAPGKLMLSGEYAVLDGAPALIAAVSARARVAIHADGEPSLWPAPEADAARRLAEAELGAVPGQLSIDVSALRSEDGGARKLGLGSSAAAAACAAACVASAHGLDLDSERRRILAWALGGHHAVAPQGSGADVAASVLGGVVRFERAKPSDAQRIAWPEGLELRVVWTGVEARTSDFIQAVRAFEARNAAGFRPIMARLKAEAERFVDAFERSDVNATIDCAGRYGDAMEALGEAAGVDIVERSLRRVAALARAAGGRAKPSGAGGGDVAIGFFRSAAAAASFERACTEAEMQMLDLHVDPDGVRAEPA